MKSILVGIIACFIALNSYAAGFDCRKAGTFLEKAICSDGSLSKLDEFLNDTYKKAIAESKDPNSIKKEQRTWLNKIRNKCQDLNCLQRVYEERIISLGGNIPDEAHELWQGEWHRVRSSLHDRASLSITKMSPQGFNFVIDSISGVNTGQIEGVASFFDKTAIYQSAEYGCVVQFKFKNRCMVVNTALTCTSFGGNGVFFDGNYCKDKVNKQQSNYFIDLGILTNNTIRNFKMLVGPSYELFEDSFQLVYQGEDLDKLNATVFSGGVRGLFTIMEGIIMQCKNGNLYAAVIDDETVKYFSNDSRYQNKLPMTIERWRARIKEKKVLFMSGGSG